VAIVGATANREKMNFYISENLLRLKFQGEVYLVNHHTPEILGMKTYPSLLNIPSSVDLAVLSLPFSGILEAVGQCVKKGIKRIVIVAGGFSETGKKGEELSRATLKLLQENSIRALGPNTLSPINTENNLVVSFHPVTRLREGGVSLVFQSGLYEYRLNSVLSRLPIAKIVDLGNKLDVNEVDALEYLTYDPKTRIIGLHVETIRGEGRRFFQVLCDTAPRKPVIILKSGRTKGGSRAAASHTGAIASENDLLFDYLVRQAGVIRAQDLTEFFGLIKAFAFLKPPAGKRMEVVSLSGGEGVIAVDACEQYGFELAHPSPDRAYDLKPIFPPWDINLNPFDLGVCMEFHMGKDFISFFRTLSTLFYDENVDCALIQIPATIFIKLVATLPPPAFSSIVDEFSAVLSEVGKRKPIALWRSSLDEIEEGLVHRLEEKKVPVYSSPREAAAALAALYSHRGLNW
jgi:acyl-CoA synthetase (NDP forming)